MFETKLTLTDKSSGQMRIELDSCAPYLNVDWRNKLAKSLVDDELREMLCSGNIDLNSLIPLPSPLAEFPEGWLSPWQLTLLYNYSLVSNGPILEVGPWVGRSTTAIAMGLRDQNLGVDTPPFDVVDLGVTSVSEWESQLGVSFLDFCNQDLIVRSVHSIGGSIGCLIDNLRRSSLLPYATSIIRGNFLRVPLRKSYSLIFCDTLHNEREIRLYGPLLGEKCRPGGFLLCDDIVDEEFGNILCSYIDVEFVVYLRKINNDPRHKMAIIKVKQ